MGIKGKLAEDEGGVKEAGGRTDNRGGTGMGSMVEGRWMLGRSGRHGRAAEDVAEDWCGRCCGR